jgi:hypothetical protein
MIWISVGRSILMFSYGVVGDVTAKVIENREAVQSPEQTKNKPI